MYITSLTIRKNGEEGEPIRQINFNKGINLIVDTSSAQDNTQTGNNVGKTTVLRLIDYCLGGNKEKIYQDPEFKKNSNSSANKIKNFLETNNICIELKLEGKDSQSITIKRNFLNYSDKIQKINDEIVGNPDFPVKLGQLMLGYQGNSLSFRQIICRNIRHSQEALSKTLKPLHATVKNTQYEALYLYWLGINSESFDKGQVTDDIKSEKDYRKKIEAEQGGNLNAIKQSIAVYETEINKLEKQKKQFNLNKDYAQDLERLFKVKKDLNSLRTKITVLQTRINLILESQQELDKTSPVIEQEKIKYLYNEAKKLIPDLQKKFEEIIAFHNSMIDEKKQFIGQQLPEINEQLKRSSEEVETLLQEEKKLSEILQKTGALEALEVIIQGLTKNYESKGQLEKIKEILIRSKEKIEKWNKRLDVINSQLKGKNTLIEERITAYNQYFSEASRTLYNQPFVLSHEIDNSDLKLNISSLGDNPGTGGKRCEIVAFDLAYIRFAEEFNIPHLNFILHDQIENIHDNQINTLLLNVVQKVDCQYIVSVLQDKLPPEIEVEKYSILTLSQDDKLFKLS